MNQCFQDFFIGFVIVVHLVTIKKFDICLLAGWSSTLFILLVNIFDNTFDEQIKRIIKNVNQQNEQCTTPSSQQTYIKLFYRNQMHYNYKSDEKILKTLIHKNILPTDPNKKIKLVIYYNKFKTSNLQPTLNRINFQTSANVLKCL